MLAARNDREAVAVSIPNEERSIRATAAEASEELEPSIIVGWANVNPDGTLLAARNIADNARQGTGKYEVVFKKASLRKCTYNATLAGAGVVSVKPALRPTASWSRRATTTAPRPIPAST